MKANNASAEDIHHEEEIIKYEMGKAGLELEEAMFVSMVSWAAVVRIGMNYVFVRKTNRPFKLKTEDYFDTVLATLVMVWFVKFEEFMHRPPRDDHIAKEPLEIFMLNTIDAIDSGEFHFDFLLAMVACMFWLRMLLMLKLTKTFGPMIKIIVEMTKDLGTFMVLWTIQLFIFGCVGILVFGELPEYAQFYHTLVVLFEASLGQWDMGIYDNLKLGRHVGVVYHLCVVILNMILLLNLVIAILSETYSSYSKLSLGLYYDGVIEAIPAYKYNKHYGGLICAAPPFNLFVAPFLPVYMCIKKSKRLKQFNQMLCKATYSPFGLILTVIFAAVNLAMMIPAYFYTLYSKLILVQPRDDEEQRTVWKRLLEVLFYAVFGLPMLLVSQFTDLYFFVQHLFTWRTEKLSDAKISTISIEAFTTLESMINKEIQRIEKIDSKSPQVMRTITLVK